MDKSDIVIGIPSFNNARTIGQVVVAVDSGLSKYFPEVRSMILNSDGGSSDGTREVIGLASVDRAAVLVRHPLYPVNRITTPYHGIPGKGSAIRTILEETVSRGAAACAVVDADLRSITPEWVELLVAPVMREGYDFVAPLYERHKFDGTITNSVVYPLLRALFGKRLRQPIGGEFGMSARLAEHYLSQDVWGTDVARFGIDVWMTTEALAGDFRVCQSYLGAKIHDPKDPATQLSEMMVQVIGSQFRLLERHEAAWKGIRSSVEVPTFGFRYAVGLESVAVNVPRMLGIFREGLRNLGGMWETVVGAGDLGELREVGLRPDDDFRFPLPLWTRIVYDYAIAYHRRVLPPDELIRSLTPLYLGKTASHVLEVGDMDQPEAEAAVERLCLEFERQKDHLENNWVQPPGGERP